MILTPRLAAVAAFVPPCGTLADIGTDHAYIPIHLLRKGVVRRAVASDVAAGPARAALANVKAYGLESRVEIVIGDGLEKIGAVDVIVMAGMGG
ncbi:MAG: class I SAM-dependent methyltransferase, partial [Clostridiales bacterium]|nr:class I SAM-dependent methyltransferase [Clostridiales bacterium]